MPKNKAAPSDHAAKLQNYVLGDLLAAPSKSGCCSDCPPPAEEAKADEVCQENCQDDTEDSDDKDKDKQGPLDLWLLRENTKIKVLDFFSIRL